MATLDGPAYQVLVGKDFSASMTTELNQWILVYIAGLKIVVAKT
jgi:hypothetical protein